VDLIREALASLPGDVIDWAVAGAILGLLTTALLYGVIEVRQRRREARRRARRVAAEAIRRERMAGG